MKYIKEYNNTINDTLISIADQSVQKFLKDFNWLWEYYIKGTCAVECFIGLRENDRDNTYFTGVLYYTPNGNLNKNFNNTLYDIKNFNIPSEKLSNSTLFISVKLLKDYGIDFTDRVYFSNKEDVKDAQSSLKRRLSIIRKFKEVNESEKNIRIEYNLKEDTLEIDRSIFLDLSDTAKTILDLNK